MKTWVRTWFADRDASPFPDGFLAELRAERRAVGASLRRRRQRIRHRLTKGGES